MTRVLALRRGLERFAVHLRNSERGVARHPRIPLGVDAIPASLIDALTAQQIFVIRTTDDRRVDRRPLLERDALDRRELATGRRLCDLALHVTLHLALPPVHLLLHGLFVRP